MVTHFEITALPSGSVSSKIGADPLEKGVRYPIERESELSFERIPSLDGFYVSDKFSYRAYDEVLGKYGNVADVSLVWKENDQSVLPAGEFITWDFINSQEQPLLSLLPLNGSTEFIEVVRTEGVNSAGLVPGERLTPAELLQRVYEVLEEGGGAPYFKLVYRAGRGISTEIDEYVTTINVESLGELVKTSQSFEDSIQNFNEGANAYQVIIEKIEVDVLKGYQGGSSEVQLDIATDFLGLNSYNRVYVEVNGVETEVIANSTLTLTPVLNQRGRATITITNYIVMDVNENPKTGTFDFTLNSINEDPALVNPAANTLSISTNL